MDDDEFGEWSQRQVDRADEYLAKQRAWERQLLSEHEARERRILDGEDRRIMSWFDQDPLEASEFTVRWEP